MPANSALALAPLAPPPLRLALPPRLHHAWAPHPMNHSAPAPDPTSEFEPQPAWHLKTVRIDKRRQPEFVQDCFGLPARRGSAKLGGAEPEAGSALRRRSPGCRLVPPPHTGGGGGGGSSRGAAGRRQKQIGTARVGGSPKLFVQREKTRGREGRSRRAKMLVISRGESSSPPAANRIFRGRRPPSHFPRRRQGRLSNTSGTKNGGAKAE